MACQVPLTDAQTLMLALSALKRTGRYNKQLEDWEREPLANQTYLNLQMWFTEEQQKQERDNLQSAGAFGTANMAEFQEFAEGTSEVLEEMNSETREAMQAITEANATLMETVQSQQRDIASLQRDNNTNPSTANAATTTSEERIFTLIQQLGEIMKGNTNNGTSNKQGGERKAPKELFYCWSHGFGTNPDHTSCKCNRKKEGHIDSATKRNRQGGSIQNAKRFKFSLD